MLEVRRLHAYYDKSHVLHGVDLVVRPGEIVSLLGRNGSGRSTTAKAIMGLVRAEGSVRWHGKELLGLQAHTIARLGVGYVPESRDVFPDLTVRENLLLGQKSSRRAGRWGLEDAYRLFPRLLERQGTPAGAMSGGEQQMLTMCRSLMGDPEILLIDEPTEGLAPKIVQGVSAFLRELRARGIAILLIEQKLTIALDVADRIVVMGHGRAVFEGSAGDLDRNAAIRKEWLEV